MAHPIAHDLEYSAGVACLAWALLIAPAARGQDAAATTPGPASGSPSRAHQLFLEGRALIEHGKPAEACERFQRSLQLSRTIGVLLNLGLCHRSAGRTATARQVYLEAEGAARESGDLARAEVARREALILERLSSRLVFWIEQPPQGLELRVDDTVIPPGRWDEALLVDAGHHTVSASAPGSPNWYRSVVARDGLSLVVSIPALPKPVRHHERPKAAATSRAHDDASFFTARNVALVTAGSVAALGLGLGIAYGVMASASNTDSQTDCRNNGVCYPSGFKERQQALEYATTADVAFVIGSVAFATGLVLWFAWPQPESQSLGFAVGPDRLDLQLTGAF